MDANKITRVEQYEKIQRNSQKYAEEALEKTRNNDGIIPIQFMKTYSENAYRLIDWSKYNDRNLTMEASYFRYAYAIEYSFVAVTQKLINVLAEYIGDRKVLSVMSGLCVLEHHLEKYGIQITCSDNLSWFDEHFDKELMKPVSKFIIDDAEKIVRDHARDYDFILMAWPPYQEDIAERVLTAMRETNPDCMMIYIGEKQGGNCATDRFFALADDEHYRIPFEELKRFPLVQNAYEAFWGLHDRVLLFK